MTTGPGSINAESYHVGGVKALYRDSLVSGGVKQSIGPAIGRTIANKSIAFVSTNTVVDAGTATDDDKLHTITGGTNGDMLILRKTSASAAITVQNTVGNIRCGGDITLSNQFSTVSLLCTPSGAWIRTASAVN